MYEETIPDLVVEVLSPNDVFEYVTEKVMEWIEAGVKEVWVVDSSNKVISIYGSSSEAHIHRAEDEMRTGLIPGFSCTPGEIFAILE